MPTPALSILLPIYNGARFLDAQIESVLTQNFTDFELLVRDDGSSDNSDEIVRRWARRDARIFVHNRSRNVGQRATLQDLLARARADRIAFCDQDDVWQAEKLQRLVAKAPAGGLAYGASPLIDATGHERNETLFDYVGNPIAGKRPLDLFRGNTVSAHAMVVDRRCITPAAFRNSSVFDWTIAVVAAANGGIEFDAQAITFHRQHGENTSNRLDEAKRRFTTDGYARLSQWACLFQSLAEYDAAAPADAACWRRFSALCTDWGTATSRACVKNTAFFAVGTEALNRLAGSDVAGRSAAKSLDKLSRGDWHPRTVFRRMRRRAANRNGATVSHAA